MVLRICVFLVLAQAVDFSLAGSQYAGQSRCLKSFLNWTATFSEAQAHCEAEGKSSLAEMRTEDHRDQLLQFMKDFNGSVWLGARGSNTDLRYHWLTDNVTLSVPTDWWVSETAGSLTATTTDCLTLNSNSRHLWTVLCSEQLDGFICEKRTQNPCEYILPGAEYFEDKCFLPIEEKVDFCKAKQMCEEKGSSLVEPTTRDLINFLKNQVRGLFCCSKSSGSSHFSWLSSGDLLNVTDWDEDEPKGESNQHLVVHMVGSANWSWHALDVETIGSPMCQKDISEECSGALAAGSCFVLQTIQLGWLEAKIHCEERNSYLMEPRSQFLLDLLNQLLIEAGVVQPVLLGAADVDGNGNLRWAFSGLPYSGEPVQQHPGNYYLSWNTQLQQFEAQNLSLPLPFICQKEFHTYTESYVINLPHAFTKEIPVLHSTSSCTFPTQSTYSSTTTSWVALSAMIHPQQQSSATAVHIRISLVSPSNPQAGVKEAGVRLTTIKETAITEQAGFYYRISSSNLTVNGLDRRDTYILVQATSKISLVFVFWREESGDVMSICSTLAFPVRWGNITQTSFFGHVTSADSSVGAISTVHSPNTIEMFVSSKNESLVLGLGSFDIETWFQARLSTTLTRQYQTVSLNHLKPTQSSLYIQSIENLQVFLSGQEKSSHDLTFDQVLPVSLLGADYVTFPSLPTDKSSNVTDRFSAVAIFNDTIIQVLDLNITLEKAGDVTDFLLPGSGFHHVNGSKPFYLYARLKAVSGVMPNVDANGPVGVCTLTLLPHSLWRSFYTFQVDQPLIAMDVYVAIVVRTDFIHTATVKVGDSAGTQYIPTSCQQVEGTLFTGCYLKLPPVKQFYSIGDLHTPALASYVFARKDGAATCHQLGVRDDPDHVTDFNSEAYKMSLSSVETCPLTETFETSTESVPMTTQSNSITTERDRETPTVASRKNITLEEAEVIAEQIKQELKVEVKATSSFRRKKETVGDFRMAFNAIAVTFGGIVANHPTLRSAGTFLSRVLARHRAAPWPGRGSESLRSPCSGRAIYTKTDLTIHYDIGFHLAMAVKTNKIFHQQKEQRNSAAAFAEIS
ncbi:mannose receptor c type 1 [Plakobranchus ocellatus]|uniref:Mannose receptor c type 1 n=1 Tax=Plakobranchus ocellatus TaxID=259542 RepID=A0AAV4BTI8_9GAST|nr:mannose receptor c type 1 [Plakobranchus ocellatus]